MRYAVLWGLQSVDSSTVTQVTRMLSECHGRLSGPLHQSLEVLIAGVLTGLGKDDPSYGPWERVLGQMIILDTKRSSQ